MDVNIQVGHDVTHNDCYFVFMYVTMSDIFFLTARLQICKTVC